MEETSPRLLIIDDDVELCRGLAELLNPDGFVVTAVNDGEQGIERARDGGFALIILDIMMPGKNGLEVLQALRPEIDTPVLMLTARGDAEDRILGFEYGADDYLAKPFNPRELLLRIKAILKRGQPTEPDEAAQVEVGPIRLELRHHRAFLHDAPLTLTGAEFRVLEALMSKPGEILSRDYLTEYALGRKLTPYDRSLDTHISHLRSKIGKEEYGKSPIRSMRGAGYMLIDGWNAES